MADLSAVAAGAAPLALAAPPPASVREEDHLREIAAHFPGMVYRVHVPHDPARSMRYSFVSAGVRQLYGVAPEAVIADPGLLRPLRHPEDVARVDAEVAAAIDADRPLTVAYRVVVDGRIKWVQMSSSSVRGGSDESVRVGVVLDVTAQHLGEQMRADRDRAESERRQMTQFLSRVSHELRTPLNAILGFAQLIEMEDGTPPHQRRWAQALLDSGRHLLELVDDVLDLSGAQSGQMTVDRAEVDLGLVLRDAWRMVAAAAEARALRFGGVPVAEGALRVRADRRRLLQVLVNLLSNAVKYNRAGGRIELQVQAQGALVCVAVADDGAGLAPEQVARLFIPFERLGAQHAGLPGTGLGLVLSRQLAEAMGGSLDAASTPGRGSVFTLSLPAAGPATAAG
ncbi:MAG: PAS domain-containing sensor histidine kinase [Proteobacteria bacterium]|nr:PAS domain-containing sensor histidine kinase [Pseudomonadota bacterium]